MNHEIEHTLSQSYTVKDLREALENADDDTRILITCNYGDYHQTQQALPIEGVEGYETDVLHESGYSHSTIAFHDPLAEPDEDNDEVPITDDSGNPMPVVIIHC